ncbi:MAG: HD domain-containing protein [Candidatus Methanomethylophilaceae archaeon]|nr:HD domain-containing protein [Candidatus Methanomethylophilaceae archaeon]
MKGRNRKFVHDPIHGSIVIDGFFIDLMGRHEIQRLHLIKQLGLGNMVFPGANHTRFEHSLGVYHLAGRMCEALGLGEEDTMALKTAGFLHDICHPPFSHTMEELMERITEKDHMDLARDLINGRIPTFMDRDTDLFDGKEPMASILEDNGVSAKEVCDLIAFPVSELGGISSGQSTLDFGEQKPDRQSFFGSKDYAHQIIHGPVDADQMDYLMRDAHYTGVDHGAIDMDRLLTQMVLFNGKMALDKGGIVAAEGLMVSRALMYSSVYYHKTVRIVEMMMTKAVEAAMEEGENFSEIYLMNDVDLLSRLNSMRGNASRLSRDVMFRRLYKKSYILYSNNLTEDDKVGLTKYVGYEKRKALENEIADEAGLDRSQVIVDIPSKSTLLSNVKIGKTDVQILDGNKLRSVTTFSPLAKSLQNRSIYDWSIMISAPKGCTDMVNKAARDIIGIDDVIL